jgi:ABC-type multidrug transport system fused ATPase/permease subunit
MKKIIFIIGDFKVQLLFILLFGLLLNSFISVTNPLALKYIFDEGIIRQNFKLFFLLSVGFVLIFTMWRFGNRVYLLWLQSFKNKVIEHNVMKMVESYYKKPYDDILGKDPGYFISRVYDETSSSADSLIEEIIDLFNLLVVSIVTLLILIYLSWRATLILLFVTPILYYLSSRFTKRIKEQTKQGSEEEANFRGVLDKALRAYKTVKIFELYDVAFKKINEQLSRYLSAFYLRYKNSVNLSTVSQIFLSYAEVFVIIVGGYEILSGRMTFGSFMAFMSAFWGAVGSIRGLVDKIISIGVVLASVERLMDFSKVQEISQVRKGEDASVKIINVDYAYPDEPRVNVLNDFTIEINPGEKVLIFGVNASGKTTLLNLVSGFLKPKSGCIIAPGIERISAGLFPMYLVPGTIADNLKLGNFTPEKMKLLYELLRRLNLTEDVLFKEFDELSAGQKRKIEVILTLLKDSDIYIFDEPLANVDSETRDEVMKVIFEKTHGKTLIVTLNDGEQYLNLFDKVFKLKPMKQRDRVFLKF